MRRFTASLSLALALLVGCNSEAAEPPPLPAVTASTTSSASPSTSAAAPSDAPSEATTLTPQGASAFARFFYAEITRAYEQKNPDAIADLSAPGCVTCDRFIASVTQFRDNDESATPVVFDIIYAEAPGFTGDEAVVEVMYNSPATVRRDRSGKVILTEPEVREVQEQVVLKWDGREWQVKEVRAA